MKDLIKGDEEEVESFFDVQLFEVVEKIDHLHKFLVIFVIGAKNAQNQDFVPIYLVQMLFCIRESLIFIIQKNLILTIFRAKQNF